MAKILDVSNWYRYIGMTRTEASKIPTKFKKKLQEPNTFVMLSNEEENNILKDICPALANDDIIPAQYVIRIGNY